MSTPPLDFTPPGIFVLDQVWQRSETAHRAERLAAACPAAPVHTFTYADLPDIVVEQGWDRGQKMGAMATVLPPSLILGLFDFDSAAVATQAETLKAAYRGSGGFPFHLAAGGGAFVFFSSALDELRPNPEHVCRPQWRLHQGRGCPHQCAYCGLGGFLITHLNTEEYIEHLSILMARNPWQKTWLYDDVMDVPTLEPQLDTLAPLMRFFTRSGDRFLIVHTKSARVEGLLQAGAPENTIVVWSLSGPTQSRFLEPHTGTTEERIEAARRCQQAGMTVRYKFKPIVPVPDWQAEAEYTVDLALDRTRPDNLSLTALMWMQVEELERCIAADRLAPDFLDGARTAAESMRGKRVAPFPDFLRERIYRHYLRLIRARDTAIPVTLCTESVELWRALEADLAVTPGTYVCGCGAGATPQLRRLATNPWDEARAAAHLDGTLVFKGQDEVFKRA